MRVASQPSPWRQPQQSQQQRKMHQSAPQQRFAASTSDQAGRDELSVEQQKNAGQQRTSHPSTFISFYTQEHSTNVRLLAPWLPRVGHAEKRDKLDVKSLDAFRFGERSLWLSPRCRVSFHTGLWQVSNRLSCGIVQNPARVYEPTFLHSLCRPWWVWCSQLSGRHNIHSVVLIFAWTVHGSCWSFANA